MRQVSTAFNRPQPCQGCSRHQDIAGYTKLICITHIFTALRV